MGYIAHDAVLVTFGGYARGTPEDPSDAVEAFRASLPEEWQRLVVGPVQSVVNDYQSYIFLPDGSKEGWADSDQGDAYRKQFASQGSLAPRASADSVATRGEGPRPGRLAVRRLPAPAGFDAARARSIHGQR